MLAVKHGFFLTQTIMGNYRRGSIGGNSSHGKALFNLVDGANKSDCLYHFVTTSGEHCVKILTCKCLLNARRFAAKANRLKIAQVLWRLAIPGNGLPTVINRLLLIVVDGNKNLQIDINITALATRLIKAEFQV